MKKKGYEAEEMKGSFRCSFPPVFCALFILFAASWYGLAFEYSTAWAEGKSVLKGKVSDAEGQAVEGAMVFVYDSPEVRRPADFISGRTDKDGLFRMVLVPGRYWLIARLKKTEGFGPLLPGDKHSGEPVETELAPDSEVNMDFIVADLKDAIKIRTEAREGSVKISGRILDEKGSPVRGAYAIAHRKEKVSGIPDYLSAWADDEGRYTLYIPRGRYYIGGAVAYPPGQNYFMNGELAIDGDKSDADIVVKSHDTGIEKN
jgi:hypothetical protein